jgi:hypothetical protein
MKFKEYQNKTSIRKKYSRYLQGGDTEVFSQRLGWWEKRTDIPVDQIDDSTFIITKKFEYKPGLVAKIFLGREDLEWLILQYNNIVDIMEEFVIGREIKIPSKQRTDFSIVIKPTVRSNI